MSEVSSSNESNTLLQRLRKPAFSKHCETMCEAADLLERQATEIEQWREKYLSCLTQRDRLRTALHVGFEAYESVRQLVDDPLKEQPVETTAQRK